jgi:DNA-binding XRE family transcriptional regulator
MERSKTPSARYIFTNKQSASNKMPRQINRNLIFNQIRTRQPISRADLARVSGLQRSTVSLIVEELLDEQWIIEGSMGQIPRGRKPTFLHLNSQRGVLALDIHPGQTTLAITDLGGKSIAVNLIPLPANPQKVIPTIVDAIRKMIAANSDRSFIGIGISVPGRVDYLHEKSIFAPNIDWPIGRIKSRIEQAIGLPVIVDNVANACATQRVGGHRYGHLCQWPHFARRGRLSRGVRSCAGGPQWSALRLWKQRMLGDCGLQSRRPSLLH